MRNNLVIDNFFVVRSPLLSLETIQDLSVDKLRRVYSDPVIQEAIFLASPQLLQALQEWLTADDYSQNNSKRLVNTLRKYLLRMAYRCTPFGLYAGISMGKWDTFTAINFREKSQHTRRSRLDMNYLCSITQNITTDTQLRGGLLFYPNNTLYQVGNQYRYVEHYTTKARRNHHLVNINYSEYVEHVLKCACKGAKITDLVAELSKEDITEEEALGFINELITNQVLVSNIEPAITGGNNISKLISVLSEENSSHEVIKFLRKIELLLEQVDQNRLGNNAELYEQLFTTVESLGLPFEPSQLLQVDMYKPVSQGQLSTSVQQELLDVTRLLQSIVPFKEDYQLEKFRDAFLNKYEQQHVPLLDALDVEMGLGYPTTDSFHRDSSPLLDGLPFASQESGIPQYSWTYWHNFLFAKYIKAIKDNSLEIVLEDGEIAPFLSKDNDRMPSSLYALFSLLASSSTAIDEGDFQLLVDSIAGPSAANFIGRFCHLNESLESYVRETLRAESLKNPEAVYAEIAHFNQARIGNISARPILREYEIPIVINAGVEPEQTLRLDDLTLCVRAGRLQLHSRRLGREVIPRLSSAHNYSLDALPVYHFLGDLQFQGKHRVLRWHWGAIQNVDFLPRVRYGRSILALAQWTLTEKEVKLLKNALDNTALLAVAGSVRAKYRMPRWVVFAEFDNKIPIDLESADHLAVLQSLIQERPRITIHECLQQQTWLQGSDGSYTNEFVAPMQYHAESSLSPLGRKTGIVSSESIQRTFALGSEWLYFKIYCGLRTADELLTQLIGPLAQSFIAKGLIDKWFFIRYADPQPHIRLRFRGKSQFYAPLIAELHKSLTPYQSSGLVSSVQTDTYGRELERYGVKTMEASESLFFYDSQATVSVLAMLEGADGESLRWQLAIRGVDMLLDDFQLSLAEKKRLMNELQHGFMVEFGLDNAAEKKIFGQHYRTHRTTVTSILQDPLPPTLSEITPAILPFLQRSQAMRPIAAFILQQCASATAEVTLFSLLGSYVHMFLNRFFRSKQRMHETVVYDFLLQYYTSELAKQRHTVSDFNAVG